MRVADVREGRRYCLRTDIVGIVALVKGATERSSRVRYVVHKKVREGGALQVGEIGIVNFASWAEPI